MLDELLDFVVKAALWAATGYFGTWALLAVLAIIAGSVTG